MFGIFKVASAVKTKKTSLSNFFEVLILTTIYIMLGQSIVLLFQKTELYIFRNLRMYSSILEINIADCAICDTLK